MLWKLCKESLWLDFIYFLYWKFKGELIGHIVKKFSNPSLLKKIPALEAKNGALYEADKIEQAKAILKPYVLRRLKADVCFLFLWKFLFGVNSFTKFKMARLWKNGLKTFRSFHEVIQKEKVHDKKGRKWLIKKSLELLLWFDALCLVSEKSNVSGKLLL